MEAIRERCQRMRISELQTFLGQNPQYLAACADIYEKKYKRLYATICVILLMTKEDCSILNLSLEGKDIIISRRNTGEYTRVESLDQAIDAFEAFLIAPGAYNVDNEDDDNVLYFNRFPLQIYKATSWETDIPNFNSDVELEFTQYFENAPYLYAFIYGLIKYNDHPTFDGEETIPLITQQIMQVV